MEWVRQLGWMEIPNIWKVIKNAPNHQPIIVTIVIFWCIFQRRISPRLVTYHPSTHEMPWDDVRPPSRTDTPLRPSPEWSPPAQGGPWSWRRWGFQYRTRVTPRVTFIGQIWFRKKKSKTIIWCSTIMIMMLVTFSRVWLKKQKLSYAKRVLIMIVHRA